MGSERGLREAPGGEPLPLPMWVWADLSLTLHLGGRWAGLHSDCSPLWNSHKVGGKRAGGGWQPHPHDVILHGVLAGVSPSSFYFVCQSQSPIIPVLKKRKEKNPHFGMCRHSLHSPFFLKATLLWSEFFMYPEKEIHGKAQKSGLVHVQENCRKAQE